MECSCTGVRGDGGELWGCGGGRDCHCAGVRGAGVRGDGREL